ncbi:MAG: hypothetical protein WCP65_04810 [Bacteroidota bacterium]
MHNKQTIEKILTELEREANELTEKGYAKCYYSNTIIPQDDNCIELCGAANKEYSVLENATPKNELLIIEWRTKYIAVHDYPFSNNQLALGAVQQFKLNYEQCIDYFLALIDKNESEDLQERVNISITQKAEGLYPQYYFTTAISPRGIAKLNKALWKEAVDNNKAFYIDGEPSLKGFRLKGNDFKLHGMLLAIGIEGQLICITETSKPVQIREALKGVLFISKALYHEHVIEIQHPLTVFIIDRVR